MDVVGVDGTRGGWVAVRLTDGKFAGGRLFSAFCVLMRDFPEAAVLAVDIPIGLPPRGRRRADEEARRVLEFRRNSVFFVPPRSVLESPTFQQAILMARSLDSSVSQQIYALRD
jgi:predicted RNase H-like nuclease